MARDLMLYYDKKTFIEYELGEIQSAFQIAFTIDGTKDSGKIEVLSFIRESIKPNTILQHKATKTWWIVEKDKVERFMNDSGYLYKHTLSISGAIEILNARDLTNCGFNINTYTIGQFINRLFSLSSFEFPITINNNASIDLTQNVPYLKSFSNYSPLSAIWEFLDGYNSSADLEFTTTTSGNNVVLNGAVLNIIPKVGNLSLPVLSENDFTDVKEIRNIAKQSFGSNVVSNVENAASTNAKIYPSVGAVRLSCESYKIDEFNACLRLPSAVDRVEWIKMFITPAITYRISKNGTNLMSKTMYVSQFSYNEFLKSFAQSLSNVATITYDEAYSQLSAFYLPYISDFINKWGHTTIYRFGGIDTRETIEGETTHPYGGAYVADYSNSDFHWIPILKSTGVGSAEIDTKIIGSSGEYMTGDNSSRGFGITLGNKQDRDNAMCLSTDNKTSGMVYYERGSNLIKGFDFLTPTNAQLGFYGTVIKDQNNKSARYTDYGSKHILEADNLDTNPNPKYYLTIDNFDTEIEIQKFSDMDIRVNRVSFQVKYIPMGDLKIKYENENENHDTHLYNQNGKYVDTFALSKQLTSYVETIKSDNITKYKAHYSYDDVYEVGQIVKFSDGDYVINNVSLEFYQNESADNTVNYFIVAQYTLSKNIAVKSLVVNPNNDIRDYYIPQNFNVKRTQLYKDYYELTRTIKDTPNSYLPLYSIWKTDNFSNTNNCHTAIMKLTYNELVDGERSYYYQISGYAYTLDRAYYEVFNFNDNNIIGYGNFTTASKWTVQNIFTTHFETINTPISYVDSKGQVKDIYIKLVDDENLQNVYDDYILNNNLTPTSPLYNYSIFIPQDIYDNVVADGEINESNYYKDAIEVPVFEYICELGSNNEVLIGDSILEQKENKGCFYGYVEVAKNTVNLLNAYGYIPNLTYHGPLNPDVECSQAVKIRVLNNYVSIEYYETLTLDITSQTFTYGAPKTRQANKDIIIYRISGDLPRIDGSTVNKEVVMIIKASDTASDNDKLYYDYSKLH